MSDCSSPNVSKLEAYKEGGGIKLTKIRESKLSESESSGLGTDSRGSSLSMPLKESSPCVSKQSSPYVSKLELYFSPIGSIK